MGGKDSDIAYRTTPDECFVQRHSCKKSDVNAHLCVLSASMCGMHLRAGHIFTRMLSPEYAWQTPKQFCPRAVARFSCLANLRRSLARSTLAPPVIDTFQSIRLHGCMALAYLL